MPTFLLLAASMVCLMLGMTIQAAEPGPLDLPPPLAPAPNFSAPAPFPNPGTLPGPFSTPGLTPSDPSVQPTPPAPPPGAELPPPGFPGQPTEAQQIEMRKKAESMLDKPGPRMPAPGDDELQQLLIARYNAAFAELRSAGAAYSHGITTHHAIFDAQKRLLQAELELSDKPADQIAAYESYLEATKAVEAKIKALAILQTVGGEADKYYQAKYMRLDAEIQLLRAKRKLGLAK